MKFISTKLEGCYFIEPKLFFDSRGYFMENFNQKAFNDATGNATTFVQENQSFSTKGVLRGLHYQTGHNAQAKLVRVVYGKVLDVAVDIRPDSPTFGQHVSVILSGENHLQLFIPKGFAHGFLVISETAIFNYKCDNFYNKESEGGIVFNDPDLQIDWQFKEEELIISDKDKNQPFLSDSRKIW